VTRLGSALAVATTVLVVIAAVTTFVVLRTDRTADTATSTTPGSSAPREATVVGVGDSVIAGSHCGCSGVPAQYATALSHRAGRPVRSVNLGVNGDTTATLEHRLDTDATTRADLREADVVLVIEGANDLVPQLETWRASTCEASCYLPAVQRMGMRLTAALSDIRQLAPATAQVIVTGYWNVFPDGAAARADGGQAEIDWSRAITRAADTAIERAAGPERATYVDLTGSFLADGSKDPTPLLASDGDHPNQAGVHAIVTDLLHVTKPLP
jgi:lysophospholipase L1-like esterase